MSLHSLSDQKVLQIFLFRFKISIIFYVNFLKGSAIIGYPKINLVYNSDLNLTCSQSDNIKFYMSNIYTNETKQIIYDKRKYIYNSAKSTLTIRMLSKLK